MKKQIVTTLFYFLSFAIFSEAQEVKITTDEYIIINLGENCSARGALEAVNLKQESYPFDSCIVPFEALIKTLEDDFHHYTNPDYFTPYIDNQSPINKYGVVLAHNFPLVSIGKKDNGEDLLIMDPEWRKVLPIVEAKYERRITRFRSACTSSKKVCFFRYLNIKPREAKQLSQLLHFLYPNLDFILICVENSASEKRSNWNIPRVKHYNCNTNAPSSLEEWMRIFREANIIH